MENFFNKINIFKRKSKWILIFLPVLLLGLFLYLIMMNNIYLKTYEIERFNRSKETIRSPITVENEAETERKMRETDMSVSDRYTIAEDITEERINYIDEFFDAIDKVTSLEQEESADSDTESDSEETTERLSHDDLVHNLQDVLSSEITENIDDITFLQFMQLDESQRNRGKTIFVNSVETVLEKGVRVENIQTAREEVNATVRFSSLDEEVKKAFYKLTNFSVVENSFFDFEKTMEARKQATSTVEPVIIRSGDIIVREGQIITNEIYEELKLAGLLNQQQRIYPAVGLGLFVIFLLMIISYELTRLYNRNELDFGKVITLLFVSIITVSLMKIMSLFTDQLNHLYVVTPIAVGVLLIKLLIYERLSIVFAVIYTILACIIFNGEIPGSLNIEAGLYFLFFQFAAILFLKHMKDRLALIKAALGMALVNIITIIMFMMLSLINYDFFQLIIHSSFGVVAAILSTVLTFGLLPFFETGLGILSENRLLALANPNQPLLKKLLTEAPGTYHHSVMVANLSETTCEAIGANGLLARVGSYYHDIGKTIKPHYFIENQVAIRNPHDFLEPEISAKIIIDHVIEGVKLLKEHNLPKEIIDIAEQHHGTSLVEYFYYKAKENNEDVSEEDFRYPGPKPLTKEAGIISICDSVEAAVRSLREPSPEKIEEIVEAIIKNRLTDGQFDDTPLTMNELHVIRETICEILKGIFHSRIQYPTKEAN